MNTTTPIERATLLRTWIADALKEAGDSLYIGDIRGSSEFAYIDFVFYDIRGKLIINKTDSNVLIDIQTKPYYTYELTKIFSDIRYVTYTVEQFMNRG